jgi:predicted metal-dependent peptidase
MNDLEALVRDRIEKARAELITSRKFYGVLVSNVEPVMSYQHPTMATDGRRHYYNPNFINTLSQDELLGVQCHESEHDARHHGTRRNGRDKAEWNVACDYAINIDLIDQGFKLPEGVLIDEKYRGMSAEDIYRARELDKEKQREEQQKEEQQKESDDKESGDDDAGDQSDKGDTPDDKSDDKSDNDQSDNRDGEGGTNSDGDSDPKEDNDKGTGDAKGTDKEEGDSESSSSQSESSDEGSGGGASAESEPTNTDPGMCGEVLDSADDASEIADQDIKWERLTRQAASLAKAHGQLPGHVTREIERANNPPRDWRNELRDFCEQGSLRIETWNRPNRRFAHSGLVLPSTQRDGINKMAVMIDTSGSVDEASLGCVRDEAQALLDDGIVDQIVVVYGDTLVTRVDTYETSDEIIFDPRGGGGTDMKPLFKYVADEVEDASCIICFTDLEIGDPGPEPQVPVLFAVHGYPWMVKHHITNAPWGAPAIDVGAR